MNNLLNRYSKISVDREVVRTYGGSVFNRSIDDLIGRSNCVAIENMVDKVLVSKEGKEKSNDDIAIMRMTFKKLQSAGKTDKRKAPKKKKASPAEILSLLEDNE